MISTNSNVNRVLNVNFGNNRCYPINIGSNLINNQESYLPWILSKQVLIVTNKTVKSLYLNGVMKALSNIYTIETIELPDGEQYKTFEIANSIFTKLLKKHFDRTCTLIALGGGVIGDITGFAAAVYQRGVNFVQVPTTLLSQVDSSVGGKTGINHSLGKNMIGAFHQPRCTIIDINTLDTLHNREFSAGLAEIIKYGLINDLKFFVWLEQHMEDLLNRDKKALIFAIERSCYNKATIVSIDEKETNQRTLLNLGHTFGHAIEVGIGYGKWLHGEAIAAGMCMAAYMSYHLNWIDKTSLKRIRHLITRANLPINPPIELSGSHYLELIAVDKKILAGKLRLVLLKGIGKAVVSKDFDQKILEKTINY